MNKFFVLAYTNLEEKDNIGVVILGCSTDPEFVISMPIPEDYSEMIKYVLDENNRKNININTNVLGVYKTMIDSWSSSDKFLSGIIMDIEINEEDEEIISSKLAISGSNGELDSVVNANFIASIILASMTNVGIIVSDMLLHKILGHDGDEDEIDEDDEDKEQNEGKQKNDDKKQKYPKDEKLMSIAKNIMSGKIKR